MIVVFLLLTALFLVGLGLALGDRVVTGDGPLLIGIAALLFYTLTVEIDATHLSFRFGIGLIRQRIPLAAIVEVKPVRNAWIRGWGIHRTPHGGLYHGSGGEAVEIGLTSGKRLRLGTDEPRKLAQAIRAVTGG